MFDYLHGGVGRFAGSYTQFKQNTHKEKNSHPRFRVCLRRLKAFVLPFQSVKNSVKIYFKNNNLKTNGFACAGLIYSSHI